MSKDLDNLDNLNNYILDTSPLFDCHVLSQNLGERQDLYKKKQIDYDKRFLDALARLCHVMIAKDKSKQEDKLGCVALYMVKNENKLHIATNNKELKEEIKEKIKRVIKKLAIEKSRFIEILKEHNQNTELFKKQVSEKANSFSEKTKSLFNSTKDKLKEDCETLFNIIKNDVFKNSNQELLEEKNLFLEKQKILFDAPVQTPLDFKNCQEEIFLDVFGKKIDEDLFKLIRGNTENRDLFRLIQDFYKVREWIKKENIELRNLGINFIENNQEIHAELALYSFLKGQDKEQKIDYIGISKLCCFMCHETLEQLGIGHRGTHGVYFTNWKVPALDDNLKKKLPQNLKNPINQKNEGIYSEENKLLNDDDLKKNLLQNLKDRVNQKSIGTFSEEGKLANSEQLVAAYVKKPEKLNYAWNKQEKMQGLYKFLSNKQKYSINDQYANLSDDEFERDIALFTNEQGQINNLKYFKAYFFEVQKNLLQIIALKTELDNLYGLDNNENIKKQIIGDMYVD